MKHVTQITGFIVAVALSIDMISRASPPLSSKLLNRKFNMYTISFAIGMITIHVMFLRFTYFIVLLLFLLLSNIFHEKINDICIKIFVYSKAIAYRIDHINCKCTSTFKTIYIYMIV